MNIHIHMVPPENAMRDIDAHKGQMHMYLVPTENGAYKAKICKELPTYDSVQLTAEGTYPVTVWYREYESNMAATTNCMSANNRDEFLCKMNALGRRGAAIMRLWYYDENLAPNEDANDLFKSRYEYQSNVYWKKTQKV